MPPVKQAKTAEELKQLSIVELRAVIEHVSKQDKTDERLTRLRIRLQEAVAELDTRPDKYEMNE